MEWASWDPAARTRGLPSRCHPNPGDPYYASSTLSFPPWIHQTGNVVGLCTPLGPGLTGSTPVPPLPPDDHIGVKSQFRVRVTNP